MASPDVHVSIGSAPAAKPVAAAVLVEQPKPNVLFVLGGPGAGKGTQCARLVKEYGYVHLSAGDLLREEREGGSPDGELIENYIREGKIVPVEITVRLLQKAMQRSGGSKFLIDGFPRNFNNLEGWQAQMANEANVQGVLMYDCPEEVMETRLLERGKTSGRIDDNAEAIRKRFRTYVDSTMPVIDHYAKQGKVYKVIANASVDTVFAATKKLLNPLVAAEVLAANETLLKAIDAGDWETYAKHSDAEMTAIEAESNYEVVTGLPFHKYYFDQAAAKRTAAAAAGGAGTPFPASQSTLASPSVKLLSGKVAVVTANRVVQRPDRTDQYGETRVWHYKEGRWQQVHFHRSPAGATAGLVSAVPAARSV